MAVVERLHYYPNCFEMAFHQTGSVLSDGAVGVRGFLTKRAMIFFAILFPGCRGG